MACRVNLILTVATNGKQLMGIMTFLPTEHRIIKAYPSHRIKITSKARFQQFHDSYVEHLAQSAILVTSVAV